MATRHPELRAVIAGVPSSVVWPGIRFTPFQTESSWTLNGHPLPFLPYGPIRLRMLTGDIGVVYRDGIKNLDSTRTPSSPSRRSRHPCCSCAAPKTSCGHHARCHGRSKPAQRVSTDHRSRCSSTATPDTAASAPPRRRRSQTRRARPHGRDERGQQRSTRRRVAQDPRVHPGRSHRRLIAD